MPTPKAWAMQSADVIMRWADAAGGEDVVIPGAQAVHCIDDVMGISATTRHSIMRMPSRVS